MRLQGKNAVVTGGNNGIGLATAKLFAAEGAKVAVTGRDQARLDAAAREIGVLAIAADVTDPEALERAFAEVGKQFGQLDVLYANAGIGGPTPLGRTQAAQFRAIVDANLTGAFLTVQAALPYLADGASVILTGSVMATVGAPAMSAYAAAKAGLVGMARVMASELAPRGIRVNVIVPSATRTQNWHERNPTPEAYAAYEASFVRGMPLGRVLEVEDIARGALYLASDDARNVTATELVVDGGRVGAVAGAPIYRS